MSEPVFFRERSAESSARLPNGDEIVVVTMWLQQSSGLYWEDVPESHQSFTYINGTLIESHA